MWVIKMLEYTDLGCDFSSNWSFENGDLKLVYNSDNLLQSIMNRLKTNLDSLDLFYNDYGSKILSFLGWVYNENTKNFMELELENTLLQDPRTQNYDVSVSYKNNLVYLYITIFFNEDNNFTYNLVLKEGYVINLLDDTNLSDSEDEEEEGEVE